MRKINKKVFLLICLISVFIVPKANGMDRREETIFLTHGTSDQFIIPLESGEEITWKFETFNNSFLATLIVSLYSPEFICIDKEEGSYTIDIDETNDYLFGIYNQDNVDGYVHYIIENKKFNISSYPLFVLLGIIGIIIIAKAKRKN